MTETRDRLPYVPALDSLRAIAVLGVLAYHHDPASVPGGWLGVSLFFTLSGFLIGGLLVAEHEREGRIDLGAFWSRRIRRLLPASFLAIGLALVVAAVDPRISASDVLPDVRAAVLNIANWHFLAEEAPYAGLEGAPSPVLHYWSLAIEEQFYLLLPIITVLALRRRLLAPVMLLVAAGSLALQMTVSDGVDRAYYGTDTRAAELAVGVGLALALPALRHLVTARRRLVDLWGAVAVAATLALFLTAELTGDLISRGGLTAVTIVWSVLVVASVTGASFPAALARGPLPALGRISYGVYLYHWPVYMVLTSQRTSLEGPALLSVRTAATLLLAAGSSALVELPVRRREVALRPVVALAGVAAAVVVAATTLYPLGDGDASTDLAAAFVPAPSAPARANSTSSSFVERTSASMVTSPQPAVPPLRAPRVLVIGDSTAKVTGSALQEIGAETGAAEVSILNNPGCATLRYEEAKIREGFIFRSPCRNIFARTLAMVPQLQPDAIVVFIGSAQLLDNRYEADEGYRSVLEPEIQHRYRSRLAQVAGQLAATGIPVLWADLPTPSWDLDRFGELVGAPMPGTGGATSNDPARAAVLNEIDAEVLDPVPGVVRWGFTAAIAGDDGVIEDHQRFDGLHLDEAEADRLAREVLFDALAEAFTRAHRELGGAAGGGGPTTWTPS